MFYVVVAVRKQLQYFSNRKPKFLRREMPYHYSICCLEEGKYFLNNPAFECMIN